MTHCEPWWPEIREILEPWTWWGTFSSKFLTKSLIAIENVRFVWIYRYVKCWELLVNNAFSQLQIEDFFGQSEVKFYDWQKKNWLRRSYYSIQNVRFLVKKIFRSIIIFHSVNMLFGRSGVYLLVSHRYKLHYWKILYCGVQIARELLMHYSVNKKIL